MLVQPYNATTVQQFYTAVGNAGASANRVFTRAMNAGTWLAWRELVNNETILGTVSQSAGVPTGAVIERGSNANGDYVRFADGTQICTRRLTSVATGWTTWTFPAAFVDALAVFNGTAAPGLSLHAVVAGAATATTMDFACFSATAQVAVVTHLMAVGRWF